MSSVILIAEDEASIADAIEIYLKSQGYQTLKAANGAIAWELLQNNTVDLAIIDVMMPVMDGIALTMKIRELYEFPIIILSAKSEDIDKITGLNIGADDYVTKPFVPMELLAVYMHSCGGICAISSCSSKSRRWRTGCFWVESNCIAKARRSLWMENHAG